MGDKKLSGIAAEDIGKCAYAIFKKGPSLAGKRIGIAGGEPTCKQMAESLTKALGEEVRYNEVSPEFTGALVFPVQMILVICFSFIAISKMYVQRQEM